MSLAEALDRRRSVREFSEDRLSPEALSQLLWSAQGTTTAWGARTAPSAGALYPLELYLVTPEGLWRYHPREHDLRTVSQGDLRPALARAALGQAAVEDAAAVVLVAGVFERTSAKYGPRAARYVMLEAGHVAQNVLLGAVALDLAAVPVGAFDDERVRLALDLRNGEEPLYLVAVGHPAVHRL